ncbi:NUDIX hydrolase [Sphingomonas xanthus]|uniref:NUDIX domain-containing protein n=1 Tax=Sphingomonas xanthus TaxID=2594473 RepID=A0A516IT75_9SPHN|nr:NUDIX domain-containing protein [Sphingomonas xanthus]QDP20060.1 NUDIX domain-containing protein [Sphingomonas xanthus]
MADDAIPAATLVLWRDQPGLTPEILVVERSQRMAFAAGALVFPGGRVDEADHAFAERLGIAGEAARITAIRETIEETAVVPAMTEPVDPALGAQLQQALLGGASFETMLAEAGLTLDPLKLVPFARWMPAFKQPRKFDTLFYLAPAPPGAWTPLPQPGECVMAEWASPAELLARIERAEASAIFPTKRNLERLAAQVDFAAACRNAEAHPLDTIIPWVAEIGGEPHVCIPADRGYPVTSEPLATAFRA